MNNQIAKLFITTLLGFCLLASQGSVYAEQAEQGTAWILVGDSPLLDRSSKYLFKGKYERGIKYAKKALARSQSQYTQVIGHHNLCMAYRAIGDSMAESHCQKAARLTIPVASLKQLKPGLYKLGRKRAQQASLTLDQLIARNLQMNTPGMPAQKLAKAN